MKKATRYWVIVVGLAVIIFGIIFGSFAASWFYLTKDEQEIARLVFYKLLPFPLVGSITLILFVSPIVNFLYEYYIQPIKKLTEEAKLISSVNPEHRIVTQGSNDISKLAKIINEAAEQNLAQKTDIQSIILNVKKELEGENKQIKEILDNIPCGLIACDANAKITYFNQYAKNLFEYELYKNNPKITGEKFLGLGRPIFDVVEEKYIAMSLDYLKSRINLGYLFPVSNFLLQFRGDPFLRVNMGLMMNDPENPDKITGFLLTAEEILHQIEANSKKEILKQNIRKNIQPALSSILNAVSAIMNDNEFKIENLDKQNKAIEFGGKIIQEQVEQHQLITSNDSYLQEKAGGISSEEVFKEISSHLKHHYEIETVINSKVSLILKVKKNILVNGIIYLVSQLKNKLQVQMVHLDIQKVGNFAELIVDWQAPPIKLEMLKQWEEFKFYDDTEGEMESLKSLIENFGGSIWDDFGNKTEATKIHFALPLTPPKSEWGINFIQGHRPVFSDYNIFNQEGQKPEVDNILLRNLTYVVFDTETTGLDPSGGDEIISIGAIRIFKDKLLQDETIDQLVNPKRPVPPSSVKIHGIKPEILKDQPTIDQVIPKFYKYAEDSVLVAHNAAFDMRFLQLKEKLTGIRFTQPILDTLLLSAIIHPNQDLHNLEDIAQRLGITITGRHTALGDAIVTGRIFLKMIPLLEANGINTLYEAREASAKTEFARLKF